MVFVPTTRRTVQRRNHHCFHQIRETTQWLSAIFSAAFSKNCPPNRNFYPKFANTLPMKLFILKQVIMVSWLKWRGYLLTAWTTSTCFLALLAWKICFQQSAKPLATVPPFGQLYGEAKFNLIRNMIFRLPFANNLPTTICSVLSKKITTKTPFSWRLSSTITAWTLGLKNAKSKSKSCSVRWKLTAPPF